MSFLTILFIVHLSAPVYAAELPSSSAPTATAAPSPNPDFGGGSTSGSGEGRDDVISKDSQDGALDAVDDLTGQLDTFWDYAPQDTPDGGYPAFVAGVIATIPGEFWGYMAMDIILGLILMLLHFLYS